MATDNRPKWARGLVSWYGFRCALKMCPHMPTRDGYICINCLDEKTWRPSND